MYVYYFVSRHVATRGGCHLMTVRGAMRKLHRVD